MRDILQWVALLQAVSVHRKVSHKAVKQTLNSLHPLSKDRLSHEPVLAHVLGKITGNKYAFGIATMMASAGEASSFSGIIQEKLNGGSLMWT